MGKKNLKKSMNRFCKDALRRHFTYYIGENLHLLNGHEVHTYASETISRAAICWYMPTHENETDTLYTRSRSCTDEALPTNSSVQLLRILTRYQFI